MLKIRQCERELIKYNDINFNNNKTLFLQYNNYFCYVKWRKMLL